MVFYSSVKQVYGEEKYFASPMYSVRKAIAQLRSSAHDLNIERGRYKAHKNGYMLLDRLCRFCCLSDSESRESLILLENMPFYEPMIESEQHVLTECPAYHHIRSGLSDKLKSRLVRLEYGAIMQEHELIDEFGKYLTRCYSVRHPKKMKRTKI